MTVYVTLDGYMVRRTTDLAVGVTKIMLPFGLMTWLPRSICEDGDELVEGDIDISVREYVAIDKGLEF